MIILHSVHSKASREFVATYGSTAGVTVLDWYDEAARQQWLDAGGTLGISAFPSVLLRRDAHTATSEEGDFFVQAGWDVWREPEQIAALPDVGQWVERGLYTYEGAFLICRQAHERMQFEPSETPALFSVWRPDSPDMIWIANEPVEVDDERIYWGQRYRALQAHTTQVDWRPDLTPALWALIDEPGDPDAWVQPTGGHDAYAQDALVTHNGRVWLSLMDANTGEPGVVGTWRDQSEPPMWVAPAGSIGLWHTGDIVTHVGQTWQSAIDNNTVEPDQPPRSRWTVVS